MSNQSARQCLAAYTAPKGPHPAYVNLSLEGGDVVVSARGAANPVCGSGPYALVRLPLVEARALLKRALSRLDEGAQ
jgi:hypothetical protein